MKNKGLTYALIAAVAAIWGMIIYRVIASIDNGDDTIVANYPAKKQDFNDFALKKDTTRLLLNYRDPFGMAAPKDTTRHIVKKASTQPAIAQVKPVFNWDFIRYSGYIRNPDSKKLVAIVTINGKKTMLAEGESFEQVKLIKNMGEAIKVSYRGMVKQINIQTAAL